GTGDAPRLDELRYPAGRRVLVRMWWTGSGSLTVNHDGSRLRFKIDNGAEQVVPLPPVPMKAQDLAAFLTATVRDGGGATGRLFAEPFLPTDPPAPVPHPDALTDPGDLAATHAEHDLLAAEFRAVGTSRDHAYELRQTPRTNLTTRFGETGPSGTRLAGHRLVPGSALGDAEPTALGMAGDLAALLCMGAASHLDTIIAAHCTGAPHVHAGPGPHTDPLGLTRQVFRRWNLDERAVNEWRTLVAG